MLCSRSGSKYARGSTRTEQTGSASFIEVRQRFLGLLKSAFANHPLVETEHSTGRLGFLDHQDDSDLLAR